MLERDWPGAFNARDLGGTPVAGGAVRPGVLFRSGQPEAWRPEGWIAAAADGVRRVFDLRDPAEPRRAPDGAEDAGIDVRFLAVDDPLDERFKARFIPYLNHPDGYADFVAMFPERVAAAVGAIVDAGPGSLVCCSAGRDRTGLVTGLLLDALGTPIEALAAADDFATRSVNARHLVRETPHPYERYTPEPELTEVTGGRGRALAAFFAGFDTVDFLRAHGVDAQAARPWLVAPGPSDDAVDGGREGARD